MASSSTTNTDLSNFVNRKNFTFCIAQERLLMTQIVFYFQKNHFLKEKINDAIERFREAGLIDKLGRKYVDLEFMKSKLSIKFNQPISLKSLQAVFGIWMFCLLFAIIIFVLEFYQTKLTSIYGNIYKKTIERL
jgi:hypothetical protein